MIDIDEDELTIEQLDELRENDEIDDNELWTMVGLLEDEGDE